MGKYNLNEVVPFMVITAGEILSDELKARGIKRREFAKKIGLDLLELNKIIKGEMSINQSHAIAFENALGIPASDWLALQEDSIRVRNHLISLKKIRRIAENL